LPEFVSRRAEIHTHYDRALADVPGLRLPPALPEGHTTSGYFYWVQMDSAYRDGVAADLRDAGVYTTFRYPPLHLVEAFRPAVPVHLPNTEVAAEETLCLPIHQGLSDSDLSAVTSALRASLEARR
ncbi:DegT/DnrJ/EryC1/StrS family aminotransferase, partial [Nocardiopsis halotolerans]|uniref:DegT/DnrJ/EryC1/StrS family aminotransferase n=1 Tax=Nocardiopsis halotolerans TaxID=124252 RepID=UPI0004767683